ncbi:hypothetical protein MtrunA17_Chr5g0442261 [Medicago truncatula]|nr:hypothetical protein MtrunA17_Chr5g0442261 [Medicago truncatula]
MDLVGSSPRLLLLLIGDRDENEKVLGLQACIAERDNEICRLKELLESEKRRADSKRKRVAETWKFMLDSKLVLIFKTPV